MKLQCQDFLVKNIIVQCYIPEAIFDPFLYRTQSRNLLCVFQRQSVLMLASYYYFLKFVCCVCACVRTCLCVCECVCTCIRRFYWSSQIWSYIAKHVFSHVDWQITIVGFLLEDIKFQRLLKFYYKNMQDSQLASYRHFMGKLSAIAIAS